MRDSVMKLLTDTPFEVGWFPWMRAPNRHALTVVVKATFDLPAECTASIAEHQAHLCGDMAVGDTFTIGDSIAEVRFVDSDTGRITVGVEEPLKEAFIAGEPVGFEPRIRVEFLLDPDDAIPMNRASFDRPSSREPLQRAAIHESEIVELDSARAIDLEEYRAGKLVRKTERDGVIRPTRLVQLEDGSLSSEFIQEGDIIREAIKAIDIDADPIDAAQQILHLRALEEIANGAAARLDALQALPEEALRANFENISELGELTEVVKDAYKDSITAAHRMARATQGSVMQYLNAEERALVEAARLSLGVSDAAQGASIMTPFLSAIDKGQDSMVFEIAMRMDLAQQKAFGRRGNYLNDALRYYQRGQTQLAQDAYRKAGGPAYKRITEIAEATGTDRDALLPLATAVMYEQINLADSAVGTETAAGSGPVAETPFGARGFSTTIGSAWTRSPL